MEAREGGPPGGATSKPARGVRPGTARRRPRRSGGPPTQAASRVAEDPYGLLQLDADPLPATDNSEALVPPGFDALGSLRAAVHTFGAPPGLCFPTEPTETASHPEPAGPGPEPAQMELDVRGGVCGGDTCWKCGGQMQRGLNDMSHTCDRCGLMVEGDSAEPDDEAPRPPPNSARLRIVGPNSNQLQPDLYRCSAGSTPVTQRRQILEEYRDYRQRYIEAGKRAFPLDACSLAADHYNQVQQICVKRSQNKKYIMAGCFYIACFELGFAPNVVEVAEFVQLPSKGFAKGLNFLRSLAADGKFNGVNIDVDRAEPEITTLFANLGLEGDLFAPLREAVLDVVQTAIRENIATGSFLRSKVAGASWVVLQRCRDSRLLPGGEPPSAQQFAQAKVRRNTANKVVTQLEAYHSYFEPCYARAGLDATPGVCSHGALAKPAKPKASGSDRPPAGETPHRHEAAPDSGKRLAGAPPRVQPAPRRVSSVLAGARS